MPRQESGLIPDLQEGPSVPVLHGWCPQVRWEGQHPQQSPPHAHSGWSKQDR